MNELHINELSATVRVQVSGDIVALLVKEVIDSVGAHLEIWNWKHGPSQSVRPLFSPFGITADLSLVLYGTHARNR